MNREFRMRHGGQPAGGATSMLAPGRGLFSLTARAAVRPLKSGMLAPASECIPPMMTTAVWRREARMTYRDCGQCVQTE